MSGCLGCLPSQSEINDKLNNILPQAKKLAVESEQNVFIYKTVDGDLAYMLETPARQEGIIPIHVVSYLL